MALASLPLALLLALLCNHAFFVAAVPISMDRGCNDPPSCPMLLWAGLDDTVTFSLDEPIICPDQSDRECAVVVTITNTDPSVVAVYPCLVKWRADEWSQKRKVRITAVQNYKNTADKTVIIKTNPAISNAEYYKNYDPRDLYIKSQSRQTAQCAATGDPHYTTFDGMYWHFYDGVTRNPTYVTYYRALNRDMVIQTQVRGNPATTCALAGRENSDLVIISVCSGSLSITSSFNGPAVNQPLITRSGNQYTVTFHSGVWMRAVVNGYYMDVYIQGVDSNAVCGLCGNFNGNKNDDAPGYAVSSYSSLFPCQQVGPGESLFSWTPSMYTTTSTTIPPWAALCNYTEPVYTLPILTHVDPEDITELIKVSTQNAGPNRTQFVFDNTNDVVTAAPFDEGQAFKICNDSIYASASVRVCAERFPDKINIPNAVQDCKTDLAALSGDLAFVRGAVQQIEAMCADLAVQNGLDTDTSLTNYLCLNSCSGQGKCVAAVCQCNPGFLGSDCSFDSTKPPTIRTLNSLTCDSSGLNQASCLREITVTGSNFFKTANLTCKFGTVSTIGIFLGGSSVLCPVPRISVTGSKELRVNVSVTNDGVTWSNPVFYVYYDGICQVCSNTGTCGPNPKACTIDGVCYLEGDSNPDNVCRECQPANSTTAWSFVYDNSLLCGPVFPQRTYDYTIVGSAPKGASLFTVNAQNPLTATDPNNQLSYVVQYRVDSPDIKRWFTVDNKTGAIRTLADIDMAALGNMQLAAGDPTQYDGVFQVLATDQAGNWAETNIIVALVSVDYKPVFPASGFNGTVAENATIGTLVTTVKATTKNANDTLRYAWFYLERGAETQFGLDTNTGAITVIGPLDYETKSSYFLQVRATDSAGMWYVGDVRVNVTNVPEPPTDIILNGTTVPENQNGYRIGLLTSIDPEGGPFTYAIVPTNVNFNVVNVGGNWWLVTTRAFDFENGDRNFSITIRTTDPTNLSFSKTFKIVTLDVNEAPYNVQLTPIAPYTTVASLREDEKVGSIFAAVSATDDDAGDVVRCQLASSANGAFQIANNQLIIKKTLDFETAPLLSIVVVCTDSGNPSLSSVPKQFNITVIDVPEAPTNVTFSGAPVTENDGTTRVIGTITAYDFDKDSTTITFTPVSNKITIGASTCVPTTPSGVKCTASVTLVAALDYETTPPGETLLDVRVTDAGSLSAVQSIIVRVLDVNEAPSDIVLDSDWTYENPDPDFLIAHISVVDPDINNRHSMTLVTNPNNAFGLSVVDSAPRRRRDLSQGLLTAHDPIQFDFETKPTMTFSVRVTDLNAGGITATFTKTIRVLDHPVVVLSSAGSFSEAAQPGAVVTTITLHHFDRPDVTPVFTLASDGGGYLKLAPGPDANSRTLTLLKVADAHNGVTSLRAVLNVNFTSTVPGASLPASVSSTITLTVDAVNKPPQFDLVGSIQVGYKATAQTVVLRLSANDPEGQAVTYGIASGNAAGLFGIRTVGSAAEVFLTQDITPRYSTVADNLVVFAQTSATDRATSTIPVTLDNACSSETTGTKCLNDGRCSLCLISGVTQTDDPIDKNCGSSESLLGYSCACADGYTGLQCQLSSTASSYTINVLVGTLPAGSYLTPEQELALKQEYITQRGLGDSVTPADLTVLLKTNADGTINVYIQRVVPLKPTNADKLLEESLTLSYTYTDGDNQAHQATVSTSNMSYTENKPAAASANNNAAGTSVGLIVGVVIGVVLLLLIVALLVLLVMRKRLNRLQFDSGSDARWGATNPSFGGDKGSATYDSMPGGAAALWHPGMTNPLYDWYRPDMTRQDCTDYLMGQGEGSFVVRDSAATPGWHMLGVKSQNRVLHEKIRMAEDGMYELLPTTATGAKQPKFRDMPALIQYYVSARADMPYTLALSNPIYDNHQLLQTRAGYAQAAGSTHDPSAPFVPLKDREVTAVAQVDTGDELYTNTAEAKSALRSRDRSIKVRSGVPGAVDDDFHEVPGYLAVGDDVPL